MSNSYEALWRHMHKKSADKFDSGNGIFFPFTFFTIILHIVSNSIFVHANDTMIADGNSVCILRASRKGTVWIMLNKDV